MWISSSTGQVAENSSLAYDAFRYLQTFVRDSGMVKFLYFKQTTWKKKKRKGLRSTVTKLQRRQNVADFEGSPSRCAASAADCSQPGWAPDHPGRGATRKWPHRRYSRRSRQEVGCRGSRLTSSEPSAGLSQDLSTRANTNLGHRSRRRAVRGEAENQTVALSTDASCSCWLRSSENKLKELSRRKHLINIIIMWNQIHFFSLYKCINAEKKKKKGKRYLKATSRKRLAKSDNAAPTRFCPG